MSRNDVESPAKPLARTLDLGLTKRHAPTKRRRTAGINPERIRDGMLRRGAENSLHHGRIHAAPA